MGFTFRAVEMGFQYVSFQRKTRDPGCPGLELESHLHFFFWRYVSGGNGNGTWPSEKEQGKTSKFQQKRMEF